MKYRKRPVVIDAEQFLNTAKSNDEMGEFHLPTGVYKDPEGKTGWSIDTLEGRHEVTNGDWIITGVKGEKYPCKPDIFEMTYEKVEENET